MESVQNCWDRVADLWIKFSEEGLDVHREYVNTPAFLNMLPEDLTGKRVIDIGCGDGWNTRKLAARGCQVTGTDLCRAFIEHADKKEQQEKQGIEYILANAAQLPIEDNTYDAATAFLSLMDMDDPKGVLRGVYRILAPGGWFQFSIIHPCFSTPFRKWVRKPDGTTVGRQAGRYFDTGPQELLFKREEIQFRTIQYHRTLSEWINIITDAGFLLARIEEPSVTPEIIDKCPHVEHYRVVPDIIIFQCRKNKVK